MLTPYSSSAPPRLVACDTRGAYLAALLAPGAREQARVPVLGTLEQCAQLACELGVDVAPAPAPVEEARLSALLAALSEERTERRLVIALDRPTALFAAALALHSGRALVCVETAAWLELACSKHAASLTIVGSPERITSELISRLTRVTGDAHVPEECGVLSARSDAAFSRLVARSLLLRREAVRKRFSVVKFPTVASSRDEHELLRWDDFVSTHAARLEERAYSVLSLTSHGDPIDLHLSGVVMCGRSSTPVDSSSSVTHTCLEGDFCPRHRHGAVPRLAIDRVKSRVIVAETCTGIAVADRVFPSALSLGLSAFDGGACAYLSTTKVLRTTGIGAQLATTLLSNGYALGECAKLVNAVHSQLTGDAPSFLLLGDPEARFAPRDRPWRQAAELPASGLVTLDAPNFEGTLVELELLGPSAAQLAQCADVFVHVEEVSPPLPDDAEVIALALPSGTGLCVLLIAARRFALQSARLRVLDASSPLRSLEARIARLERRSCQLSAIANAIIAAGTPAQQACVAQLPLLLEHARSVLASAVQLLSAARIRATTAPLPPLHQTLEELLNEELGALDGSLAQGFPCWGLMHYQVPLYGSLLSAVGPERVAATCYRCGLPTFEIEQRAAARPDLARIFTHCAGCDLLFDRLADEAPVQIHGQNPVESGGTATRELYVENDSDEPRSFAAALYIEGNYPWFEATFEPSAIAFEVPARSSARIPFQVRVGERSAPGVYRLTAFTTSDLSWSLSVEPFVVARPAAQPIFLRRHGGSAGGT